jgi:hypothetical protein
VFEDTWYGYTLLGRVSVQAGYRGGVGVIAWRSLDDRTVWGEVTVPGGARKAFITDTRNTLLTITTDSGATHLFDAEKMVFVAPDFARPCCDLDIVVRSLDPDLGRVALDLVAQRDFGEVASFQFILFYDDWVLMTSPVSDGARNPVLDSAFGPDWECSLPGESGTPDIDPAGGPGHGVAFLSCFTIAAPVRIAPGTVIATFQVSSGESGWSNVQISEAVLGGPDGSVVGACNPPGEVPMTCGETTIGSPRPVR